MSKSQKIDPATLTSEGKPSRMVSFGQGLYLQITANGSKAWIKRWSEKGIPQTKTIGKFPELREKDARALIGSVKTEFYPAKLSFERYVTFLGKINRADKTIAQYEYLFKVILEAFEHFNIKDLAELKRENIKPLFVWILKNKTDYAANGCYPLLGAVYKYLNSAGGNIDSPFDGLKKHYVLEMEYKSENLKSYKDPADFKRFVAKVKTVENLPIARNCILAICHLPLRPSEMMGLRWSEIDRENRVLYIEPSRNKTKKHLYFPITDELMAIFDGCRNSSEFVFQNRLGGDDHIRRDALTRLVGLPKVNETGNIDIHGLRHTFRTIADEHLGLDRLILEVILGHNVGSRIEQIYNKSTYMKEKQKLLEVWSKFVNE